MTKMTPGQVRAALDAGIISEEQAKALRTLYQTAQAETKSGEIEVSSEFATDMAGFAINVNLILRHPEAAFPTRVRIGELEDVFLRQLVTRDELEPRAANCTQVGHPPFTSGQPVTMSTNHSYSFLATRFWCGTLGRRR